MATAIPRVSCRCSEIGVCGHRLRTTLSTRSQRRHAEIDRAFLSRVSLWAAEHSHIPVPRRTPAPGGGELAKRYYDVMDPFITLTAAAAATKRLKIATGICLVIQRDTIQTAKLVASIDQVSGGRFLFGIGGGWNAEEIENHGTEFPTRFKRCAIRSRR